MDILFIGAAKFKFFADIIIIIIDEDKDRQT